MTKILLPRPVPPSTALRPSRHLVERAPAPRSVARDNKVTPISIVPRRGEVWRVRASQAETKPDAILGLVISADGLGHPDFRQVACVSSGRIQNLEWPCCVPLGNKFGLQSEEHYFVNLELSRPIPIDHFLEHVGRLSADYLEEVNATARMLWSGG